MKPLTLLLLVSILFSACEKEEPYVSPVVKTISATLQEDGSVEVIGELTEGNIDDTRLGIMRRAYLPPVDDDEDAYVEIYGKRFKTTFYGFEKYIPYYFMAYAIDDNGKKLGNLVKIDSIYFPPVEVPCTLADNKLTYGMGFQNVNYVTQLLPHYDEYYKITASCPNAAFDFIFYKMPRNGVYKTVKSQPSSNLEVAIDLQISFEKYRINENFYVYINEISRNVYSVDICNAEFDVNTSKVLVKGNFISPR